DSEQAETDSRKNGQGTQQERGDELGGYSPAPIAAEIAALRAAARVVDPVLAATLRMTAARWDASLETWTFGPGYYLRVSPDGKPNSEEPISIANGGGVWDQREIVDPSFLELVRLGVRSPHDPRILLTLKAVDNLARCKPRCYPHPPPPPPQPHPP